MKKQLSTEEAALIIAEKKEGESNHVKFQKTWNNLESRLALLIKISAVVFLITISAVFYYLSHA